MTLETLAYSSPVAGMLCHFYEAGNTLLIQNKQTAISFTESFFYNRAESAYGSRESLLNSIHHLALNNFQLLQTVFYTVNAMLTVYSTHQIVAALNYASIGNVPTLAFGLILISASGWVLSKPIQSEELYKSKIQILSGTLQLIGIVQSLALAALTENKISCLIRAIMNGYSLYKNTQFNWLSVRGSCQIAEDSFSQPRIKQIDVTYHALLFSKLLQSDSCAICFEEKADQVFCTNQHTFHHTCLKGYFISRKKFFYEANRINRQGTDHYHNGMYTRTSYTYKVNIDETKLPACPTCREYPPHNQLKITVHDQDKGIFPATVDIQRANPKNYQNTFEKVYAIYNTFQGILGVLQQIPEFTGGITTLRRFMIISDLAMGVLANYYLFKNLEEKEKNLYMAIAPVVLTALPFSLLNHFFDPKGDLTQLNLNNVTARWERPFTEQAHRALDAYRFLTTLGLTYLSKSNKISNTISLLSQAVGLVGAMNVHWLRVDQKNIGKIYAEFSTYTVLPSSISKNTQAVKNSINYIVNLQQRIVNEGVTHLVNHYTNGLLTKQTLNIRYTMEKIQDLREYLFKPFIWTWDGLTGKGSGNFKRLFLSINLS